MNDKFKVLVRYLNRQEKLLRQCVCKKHPHIFADDTGFHISCARCGRETPRFDTPSQAVKNWNTEPDIASLL